MTNPITEIIRLSALITNIPPPTLNAHTPNFVPLSFFGAVSSTPQTQTQTGAVFLSPHGFHAPRIEPTGYRYLCTTDLEPGEES